MPIISKKELENLKINKDIFDYMARGYKANFDSLNYQSIIISIMKKLNINEIELDDFELYNNIRVDLEMSRNPINYKTILKIKEV